MPALAAWIVCSTLMLFLGAKLLVRELGGQPEAAAGGLVRPDRRRFAYGGGRAGCPAPSSARQTPGSGEFGLLLLLVACGALVYSLTVWALWLLAGRPETAERELVSLVQARVPKRLRRAAAN